MRKRIGEESCGCVGGSIKKSSEGVEKWLKFKNVTFFSALRGSHSAAFATHNQSE